MFKINREEIRDFHIIPDQMIGHLQSMLFPGAFKKSSLKKETKISKLKSNLKSSNKKTNYFELKQPKSTSKVVYSVKELKTSNEKIEAYEDAHKYVIKNVPEKIIKEVVGATKSDLNYASMLTQTAQKIHKFAFSINKQQGMASPWTYIVSFSKKNLLKITLESNSSKVGKQKAAEMSLKFFFP